MNSNEIFSESFLNRVLDTLNEECPEGDGQRITRTDLANKLELEKDFEPTLGAMIKYNMLPGWTSFKGVNGGIGRVGEAPAKKSSGSSAVTVSDEFVASVADVLANLVTAGSRPVPRRTVAEQLGSPGSKTETMVSAALKHDSLAELYNTRRGKGGGIVLRSGLSKVEVDDVDEVEEVEDSFTNVETDDISDSFEDEISSALADDLADSMSDEDVSAAV